MNEWELKQRYGEHAGGYIARYMGEVKELYRPTHYDEAAALISDARELLLGAMKALDNSADRTLHVRLAKRADQLMDDLAVLTEHSGL